MDLFKLGIKFFMTDTHAVQVQDLIAIFQKWIQGQVIQDHLLVDVHNYSHIHNGPGILLVAHEGNFSIDSADGRTGLLYQRKHPGGNPLKTARQACSLLEADPALKGRIRFRTDELQLIANDRLLAPNDDKTFSQLESALLSSLQPAFEGKRLKLTRTSQDPKERLTIRAEISS